MIRAYCGKAIDCVHLVGDIAVNIMEKWMLEILNRAGYQELLV